MEQGDDVERFVLEEVSVESHNSKPQTQMGTSAAYESKHFDSL